MVIPGAADPNAALEGIFVAGDTPEAGGCVVAAPHPLYGGSLESPVVGEVAHACGRAGLATLRFNWRGVGASAGERSGDPAAAAADYAAALEHLAETVEGPLLAAGYSFGAVAALSVGGCAPRVARLVLVCPPASMLDRDALGDCEARVLIVAGGRDEIAPARNLEAIVAGNAHTLEVIPEADHFFMDGLAALSRIVSAWLGR